MNSAFFTMSTLVNKKSYAHTLYDTDCLFYEMITSCFAQNHNLQCMKINSCMITEFDEPFSASVKKVVIVQIDIDEHQKSKAFFYIVPKIASYDLILSLSWMKQNEVILNVNNIFLTIEFTEIFVWNREVLARDNFSHFVILTMSFTNLIQKKKKKQKKIEVFSVSMTDIEKVLTFWKKTDSWMILSGYYHNFLNIFDHMMTEKLLSLRGKEIDHCIELKEIDEKKSKMSWDLLYNMTWEELLMLRKTLMKLLNKQFI